MKRMMTARTIGLAAGLLAGTVRAAEFKWNAAAAGNASVMANWLQDGGAATRLPSSGDAIVLDGTSVQNMTWNGGANTGDGVLTDTVGSWTQTAGYSGTVTLSTVYSGTFTLFTVAGNCTISNGVWTHLANAGAQTYRLHATIAGNLALGATAAIDADGKGKSTGGDAFGANHGGFGGANSTGTTYGDIREPVDIGSSTTESAKGGGAIRLTVDGEARLDGRLSANALTANYRAGSGGSVNLRAGTLTGSGTGVIQARGGNANVWFAGGGGRVAVRQAGAVDFTAVTIDAAGGAGQSRGGWYRNHGMAGTVYLQGSSHTEGQGQLIVDNIGRTENQSPVYTQVTSGYDYRVFSSIAVKRGGRLGIGAADTFDFSQDRVSGDGRTTATVTVRSIAGVNYPAPFVLNDNYTLELAVPTVINGDVTVANGSAVSHPYNLSAQTYVLDLTVNGALDVQSGGYIDVTDRGFEGGATYGATAPGYSVAGGSHGGQGASATSGKCYGSIFAPTNIGSGGSHTREAYGTGAGGGAIKLTVGGATTVDGSVLARGGDQQYNIGSGGSISLRAASLTGGGTLDARGANASIWRAGGGGRVAVILTGSDTFGATPTLVARGGSGGSTAYTAAGGTVYMQGQSDAAGAGLCVVDFGSLTTGDYMLLPPDYVGNALYQFNDDLTKTGFRLQNKARVKLTGNVTTRAFTINNGTVLELNGFTLTVEELTVAGVSKPNGAYYDADFTEVTGSGQIVVFNPPQGTVILLH